MKLEIPFVSKKGKQELPISLQVLDLPNKLESDPDKLTIKKDKDPAVDFVFENPEIASYARINYSIPEYGGRELKPGRRLLFLIPSEFF